MIDVTIVVCTRNRVDALQLCLASISRAALQCPAAKIELVVVDNRSTDNTREFVSTWLRSTPFPVQFVEERRPGLGAARNTGVRNARSACIASPHPSRASRHSVAGQVLHGAHVWPVRRDPRSLSRRN